MCPKGNAKRQSRALGAMSGLYFRDTRILQISIIWSSCVYLRRNTRLLTNKCGHRCHVVSHMRAPEAQTSKLSRRTQSLTRYNTQSLSAEKIRTHPMLFPARRDSSPLSVPSSRLCISNPSIVSLSWTYTGERLPMVTTLVQHRTTG